MISVRRFCELTSAKKQRDREISFIFRKKTSQARVSCFAVWTDEVIVFVFGVETTPSTRFRSLSPCLTERGRAALVGC